MRKRYYQFAGMTMEVSIPEELFFETEAKLVPFRVEAGDPDWIFRYETAEKLLPPEGKLLVQEPAWMIWEDGDSVVRYVDAYGGNWREASARVDRRGTRVSVRLRSGRFPYKTTEKFVLDCFGIEHLLARNDGFIFHCSFIEHRGKAILFTAPSGTGKSTQAELWKALRGADIINGDRAAVRLAEGTLLAEGIPFAGSSEYCKNRSLPIAAIVYLGQAPTTSIRKVRGYEAFFKLWEGVSVNTWDKEDMERVSAVVQRVAEQIPVYHLPCTPDESAVLALEEALRKQVNL